jgi:hypothetical protein
MSVTFRRIKEDELTSAPNPSSRKSRKRDSNAKLRKQHQLRTFMQWLGVFVLIVIFAVLWRMS